MWGAIGLGIAHEESQKHIDSKDNEEKTPVLPLLLPPFPHPSIKSTLLDQLLGKIFDPSYSHIPISILPMSYDFDRVTCGLGECYNIREHMTLP
ncbi:unnamed protein product [Orchesella dallaii]|uniref:Uncharacterized protein n=1 Tax=Orchesella dallaii TaxID=48710 RepID=A0ABP1PLU6_9HEXA